MYGCDVPGTMLDPQDIIHIYQAKLGMLDNLASS